MSVLSRQALLYVDFNFDEVILSLVIGMDNFEKLQAGAHFMDQHFLLAPLEQNVCYIPRCNYIIL